MLPMNKPLATYKYEPEKKIKIIEDNVNSYLLLVKFCRNTFSGCSGEVDTISTIQGPRTAIFVFWSTRKNGSRVISFV